MRLFFADEADQSGNRQYFCMAGIIIMAEQAAALHTAVSKTRKKFGFAPQDKLKFSPADMPKGFSRKDHAAAKDEILVAAHKCECTAICYLAPRAIVDGQPLDQRMHFGVNTLLMKYHEFLVEQRDCGLAFFDRTNDYNQQAYFKEVFQVGSRRRQSRDLYPHILAYSATSDGHSHFSSVADIVTGAFRFVVNEPSKDKVGAILLGHLSRLMWKKKVGNSYSFSECGFVIRPMAVRRAEYQADINATIVRIDKWLANPEGTG